MGSKMSKVVKEEMLDEVFQDLSPKFEAQLTQITDRVFAASSLSIHSLHLNIGIVQEQSYFDEYCNRRVDKWNELYDCVKDVFTKFQIQITLKSDQDDEWIVRDYFHKKTIEMLTPQDYEHVGLRAPEPKSKQKVTMEQIQ
jgi:hypothetical protein